MENEIKIEILRLPGNEDLSLPQYMSPDAAGLDLYAAVKENIILEPMERCLVPTGIIISIPSGYEGQVRPRSGLALKHGVTLLNSPGTIDADYRGEVGVIMVNFGKESFCIKRGERIAQLILAKVVRASWEEVKEISKTERGKGGFGSTGK